jgi:adenine deaminase
MTIDILFRNASVYNVYTRKWITQDVAVLGERILYTGKASAFNLEAREEIDCSGRPLIPGMIDIHLHIESSFCTPVTFGKAVLSRGVTTVVSEPHEIANVFGIPGIEEMIRVSDGSPADIFYGIPSSVPSTSPSLETTGGRILPEDAEYLFRKYSEVLCLGEVMNYEALARMDDPRSVGMINRIRSVSVQVPIEGHCPSIREMELAKVLYAGVDSDHCLQDPEGMIQRFENGMFVELQEKSITPEIIATLNQTPSEGLYSFVTDDVAPDILMKKGHLDFIVRKAMRLGLPLEQVVTATSWAPACRMGLRDRGAVSPGKLADFLLLKDNSADFEILEIFKKGKKISELTAGAPSPFSRNFKEGLNLKTRDIRKEMFLLKADGRAGRISLRSIEKNPINTYTTEGKIELPVRMGLVDWENKDCNLVIVTDRYTGKASFAQGLMTGDIFRGGAVASSHAHDNHNLLAAGDNGKDLETAMKWVIENQGGICVVSKGEITASVRLEVGGIISEQPLEDLVEEMDRISKNMKAMGFTHPNPIMSFCTLTLPVSPAVKITDKGLIRTSDGTIQSLMIGA